MVGESGRVRLLDFGVAKVVAAWTAAELTTASGNTTHSALIGTPAYMAPEQVQQRPVDGRTDLFSLGVVLYECLIGRRPFEAATPYEIVANVLHVEPPPPSDFRPELTAAHDTLCARLLAKQPADRFQSAADVAGAIHTLLRSGGDHYRPAFAPKRRFWAGRRALAAVLIAIAAIIGGWRWTRPSPLPTPTADARRWYEQGTEALREGTYHKARTNLEEATRVFPDFALAYARLAEADVELDDERSAQRRLLRLSELVPEESRLADEERLRVHAVRALVLHDLEAAISAYRELANRHPADGGAWVDLGRAQDAAGLRTDAADSFQRAVTRDGQYAAAYLRLGTVEGAALHLPTALKAFGEAERLYTAASNIEGLTEVLLRRGAALDAASDVKSARADLERALSLATTANATAQRIRALMSLSSVVATEGRLGEAERMAAAAVQDALAAGLDTIAAEGLIDLGATLADREHYAEASVQAERAVKLAAERGAKRSAARANLQLGEIRRLQGRLGEALTIVDEVLPFVRANRYRRLELFGSLIAARAHDDRGETEQARTLFSNVLTVAETLHDDSRIALAASDLAGLTTNTGRYTEALALRERAETTYRRLGDQGSLPYALANHADLLIRLGRYGDAERLLAELEAGIAQHLEAYVGRRRRTAFLRMFAATSALRCDEALGLLARVQPDPRGLDSASVLAPALRAFCAARLEQRDTPIAPAPDGVDVITLADRHYWLAFAALVRGRNDEAAIAAERGLAALGTRTHDELRWRLEAVVGSARSRPGQSVTTGRQAAARAALARAREALSSEFDSYAMRPDLVYLRKRSGL
jgi:tetratricopeptide (TPR) repeat protein